MSHVVKYSIPKNQTDFKSFPPGLERAVLRILEDHRGRENATPMHQLLEQLALLGFKFYDSRPVRAAISQLRKDGYLLCSAAAADGGHFVATNPAEINDFIERELNSRISDLAETKSALKTASRDAFGEGWQMGLGL